MNTYQEKTILSVIKLFDGMYTYQVYDILQKIEELLCDYTSPIPYKDIKHAIETTSKKDVITTIHSYGCYSLEDECQYIKIYTISPLLPTFLGEESIYFTTPKHPELTPYTNAEVQKTFANTHLEPILTHFFKTNNAKKRNPKTKRLILLELLDRIDPEEK
ncbi:hypothetical protein [Aquimarina longa]|uniref:hypothetical protein n=1 Tax=Aquimarina longa TaxID=1080221 RepID=UPI000783AA2A|nr:hypothetical protein [Aquimarina longa]